jgi:hypothetical protein
VSADAVEAQVWRVIEQLLINEATVERLIAQRQARVEPERDRLQYSLEAVAASLAKCVTEETRLEDAYLEGVIDLARFARRHAELQERQTALERTQQELQAELARVAAIDVEANRLRAAVAQAAIAPTVPIQERRAIIRGPRRCRGLPISRDAAANPDVFQRRSRPGQPWGSYPAG